jgi:hypothetical protein
VLFKRPPRPQKLSHFKLAFLVPTPHATIPRKRQPEGFYVDETARLTCVRHAASLRPEPGSNSP